MVFPNVSYPRNNCSGENRHIVERTLCPAERNDFVNLGFFPFVLIRVAQSISNEVSYVMGVNVLFCLMGDEWSNRVSIVYWKPLHPT